MRRSGSIRQREASRVIRVQRDNSRASYARNIAESEVAGSKANGEGVCDRWGEATEGNH
jgi:hypothetical protein